MSAAMIYKWSFFLALLRACASGKVAKEEHTGYSTGSFTWNALLIKADVTWL